MTIEAEVALLTTAVTAQTTAVVANQLVTTNAQAAALATKNRVEALDEVDNTSDLDKPVSNDVTAALGLKQNNLVSGATISTINGVSLLTGDPLVIRRSPTSLVSLAYADRGILSYDPVDPNPANVLDDSVIVEGIGLFMWVTTTEEPNDDETCFTTPSGQWLLRTPAYDLLAAYATIEDSIVQEFIEDQLAAQA